MVTSRTISRDEVLRILRRAGFSTERIDEIATKLPEQVDTTRDEALLASYGVTRSLLMDMFGGSP